MSEQFKDPGPDDLELSQLEEGLVKFEKAPGSDNITVQLKILDKDIVHILPNFFY